jgi:hypothetical protein
MEEAEQLPCFSGMLSCATNQDSWGEGRRC